MPTQSKSLRNSAKIVFKAGLLTLAVIAVSQVVSITIRLSSGQQFTAFVFVMNSILPFLTAFPAAMIIFRQNEKLKQALEELALAHAQLEAKSSRDQMTGFLNREAFFETFKQARRKSDVGALALIDADHFKTVNDTYGHLVGDEALKLISGAIRSSIREHDIAGRVGGEEFCVFLPGAQEEEAAQISERIRAEVEKLSFRPDGGPRHPLTVSIGVALTNGQQPTSQVMRRADRCLYDAKEQGRNAVVLAAPLLPAA